ncbi:hypothetical protein M407DRAFT_20478 [Tulasnella calospora MUT 4182]|uniref:F-box domain-containing protein n=1 Tax=Tulasnella calospora MUT 4182 TaxID=1051891 RepID=A0A0C3QPW9_9AGAM|nr:hypothetical protein M407DRAFT_20478 [Tulasnella calospora MUT 4182]
MDILYQFKTKLLETINALYWRERPSTQWDSRRETPRSAGHVAPSAFIHNLPRELLIEIFLSALENPLDVHRLSSVCKYWRGTILNCPYYWQVIDSRQGKRCWPQILRRGKNGPLIAQIRVCKVPWYGTDPIPHLIQLITPESRRIHAIDWTVEPSTPYFQPFFENVSLLHLTKLTVSVWPWVPVPVPIHIGDGVPLRQLDLDRVTIPWDTPRLGGLETLSLSNLNGDSPTLPQLRHILLSAPLLRHLSISNWRAESTPGFWATQVSSITLPSLTVLEVRSLSAIVHSRLLSMLDVPSLTKVLWNCADGWALALGPLLLRRSAQCVKASPEIVINWYKKNHTLHIRSKMRDEWSKPQDTIESCKSVDLSIQTSNGFRLIKQVGRLLSNTSSILFETDSKRAAKRVRRLALRSNALIEVQDFISLC